MGYEALLSMRPTNVMHQLGVESKLPLVNARLLFQGLAGSAHGIWAPNIFYLPAVESVARAATHQNAVVGYVLAPHSADSMDLKRSHAPGPFFHAVMEAVGKVENATPFFLHVQEPPVENDTGPDFDSISAHMMSCFDAGFTSFGIDLSVCSEKSRVAVAKKLFEPLACLELATVIGWSSGSRPDAEEVVGCINQLQENGIQPDLVILPGLDELGPEALVLSQEVAVRIPPCGVAWKDVPEEIWKTGRGLKEGGVQVLLGDETFERAFLGRGKMPDPETLEAVAYMETYELLKVIGSRGSADTLLKGIIQE
jgi:hypothetical protein